MNSEASNDDMLVLVSYYLRFVCDPPHRPQKNTQSGSQWDGMRHFGIFGGHNVFYNKCVFRVSRTIAP
jgi:hypothetical protein